VPLLNILEFPDPRLRTKAQAISLFDDNLKAMVEKMFATMYAAPGIGLAATQVDYHHQLIVIDVSVDKDEPLVLINPEILEKSEEHKIYEEGCLSVPEYYAEVSRADKIKVKAQDVEGNEFELEADGLLSVCIQHEMDHLIGKLFVDYLSPLKRNRVRKFLEKQRKNTKVVDKMPETQVV